MTDRPYDLIELHLTGGPWTQDEALKIERRALAAIRKEFGNTLSPYVADVRGEDTEKPDGWEG